MSASYLEAVAARRSHYPLKKESPISDARIQEIINDSLKHTPSSFNSQSTRLVVLLGAEHEKLWEIVKTAIKAIVPAEAYPASEQKLNMFKASYGTVLFYEDRTVVSEFQEKYTLYAEHFPTWAAQSDAMTQHIIWTALSAEGLGANLQHYSNLIHEKVAAEWKVPATWEMTAQLVFGATTAPAGEKTFQPIEERVKVYGA